MQYFARKKFGKHLGRFFDRIYCINLDTRPDRWRYARTQFARFGLKRKITRFPGIDLRDDPALRAHEKLQKDKYSLLANCGCILSHRKIVETASKLGLKSVLVLEDDVKFLEENTPCTPYLGRSK